MSTFATFPSCVAHLPWEPGQGCHTRSHFSACWQELLYEKEKSIDQDQQTSECCKLFFN